jgi:hypothetical protein
MDERQATEICFLAWKVSLLPAATSSPPGSSARQENCVGRGVVSVRKFLYLRSNAEALGGWLGVGSWLKQSMAWGKDTSANSAFHGGEFRKGWALKPTSAKIVCVSL